MAPLLLPPKERDSVLPAGPSKCVFSLLFGLEPTEEHYLSAHYYVGIVTNRTISSKVHGRHAVRQNLIALRRNRLAGHWVAVAKRIEHHEIGKAIICQVSVAVPDATVRPRPCGE